MWNSGCLDSKVLPDTLFKEVKGEKFAEGTEKCKTLGIRMDKELKKLEDHGCSKFQKPVVPEAYEEM